MTNTFDHVAVLRDGALRIEIDGTPSQVGPNPTELRAAAAELVRLSDEIEVLRHYGNKHCTGMADEYLDECRQAGRRPFTD